MILVTGATGTVGKEVVGQLLTSGASFRVLVRDPAKVAHLQGKAEIVKGDLEKEDTLDAAMKGVERVFLLTVDHDTTTDRHMIQAAKRTGARHIVKLSTNFVSNNPPTAIGRWHGEKEEFLKASGLAWTILRPGGFMSNSLQWAGSVKAQATVYSTSGDTKSCPVDPRDIAAVACAALTASGHEGQTYELSGPELLSMKEQVEILSKILGKPLKVAEVPVSAAVEGMRKNPHMSPQLIDALGEMMEAIRAGTLARKPVDTVERITGKKPGNFESWCRTHKSAFL